MGGFEIHSTANSSYTITEFIKHNCMWVITVKRVCHPACTFAVIVPAIYMMVAVGLAVETPVSAGGTEGKGRAVHALRDIYVIAAIHRMIIINLRIARQDNCRIIVVTIPDINSSTIASEESMSDFISCYFKLRSIFNGQITLTDIQSRVMVVSDV